MRNPHSNPKSIQAIDVLFIQLRNMFIVRIHFKLSTFPCIFIKIITANVKSILIFSNKNK